jgi:hypothetical protein
LFVLSVVGFESENIAFPSSDPDLAHATAMASSESLTRLLSSECSRQSNDLIIFLVGHNSLLFMFMMVSYLRRISN